MYTAKMMNEFNRYELLIECSFDSKEKAMEWAREINHNAKNGAQLDLHVNGVKKYEYTSQSLNTLKIIDARLAAQPKEI